MKICPACGLQYSDDVVFCHVDGVALAESKDPRLGLSVAGRYDLTDVLGQGGMATVYRASDAGRPVAVKILHRRFASDEKLGQRLEREARSTAKLTHPNIVEIYDYGRTEGGEPYLVMELLVGCPLDQELRRRGQLTVRETVSLSLQIARGLARAHDFGVVHRDVKPENIFVCKSDDGEPVIKLVDFGLAVGPDDHRLTSTGKLIGSPSFMAPERFRERSLVSPASDLYALGMVMFEMLAGELPFKSENLAGWIFHHLESVPPRVREVRPDVPEPLDDLIDEMLRKEPAERPVDAHAVIRVLESLARQRDRRVRRVSTLSTDLPTGGEMQRLLGWERRAEAYKEMVRVAWPQGDGPVELKEILSTLLSTLATLREGIEDSQLVRTKLEMLEESVRVDRERLGHAVEVLGADLSRARHDARVALAESSPAAPPGGHASAFHQILERVLEHERQSPEVPTETGLALLRGAVARYGDWLRHHEKSGVRDLEFQLQTLRSKLEDIEKHADASRKELREHLSRGSDGRQGLELRVLALSQQLARELRPRRELAGHFESLRHGHDEASDTLENIPTG